MDPRQMVALRKALAGDAAPAGEGAESPDEMMVECPECGCQFDPNAAPGQSAPPGGEVPAE